MQKCYRPLTWKCLKLTPPTHAFTCPDAMLLEAFGALLNNQSPSAEDGQKYVLTYVIYNGSTANESMSVIKTDGVWVAN